MNKLRANYAATRTNLLAMTIPGHAGAGYDAYGGANTRVVKIYMTEAERDSWSPSLMIGTAAVLDESNYSKSYNRGYAKQTYHTIDWGDQYPVWGQFLQPPQRIPTNGENARLNDAKGIGSKTIIYFGQTAQGTGDGLSILTFTELTYDILVLCGTLSRFTNEGSQAGLIAGRGFIPKSGTSTARTQVLSHPVDT